MFFPERDWVSKFQKHTSAAPFAKTTQYQLSLQAIQRACEVDGISNLKSYELIMFI